VFFSSIPRNYNYLHYTSWVVLAAICV